MTTEEVLGTIFFLIVGLIATFCPSCFIKLENARDEFWGTTHKNTKHQNRTDEEKLEYYRQSGYVLLSIAGFFIVAAIIRHITLTS